MVRCDKCCTTTSLGRPPQRCPATSIPLMMCRTASASHTGHGTDSRGKTPRLTCNQNGTGPNFEAIRPLDIDPFWRNHPASRRRSGFHDDFALRIHEWRLERAAKVLPKNECPG